MIFECVVVDLVVSRRRVGDENACFAFSLEFSTNMPCRMLASKLDVSLNGLIQSHFLMLFLISDLHGLLLSYQKVLLLLSNLSFLLVFSLLQLESLMPIQEVRIQVPRIGILPI